MVEMETLQHLSTQQPSLSKYVDRIKARIKTLWKNKKAKSEEDKTLHTTNSNLYIVRVKHIGGELLLQRAMTQVPHRQDCVKIGDQQYVVTAVLWNYNDARTVTLGVRNL